MYSKTLMIYKVSLGLLKLDLVSARILSSIVYKFGLKDLHYFWTNRGNLWVQVSLDEHSRSHWSPSEDLSRNNLKTVNAHLYRKTGGSRLQVHWPSPPVQIYPNLKTFSLKSKTEVWRRSMSQWRSPETSYQIKTGVCICAMVLQTFAQVSRKLSPLHPFTRTISLSV